jgi:hypothetical protein
MALPPLEAANHPLKVYPDRVGVPGDPIAVPQVPTPSEIALPPCVSYVIVKFGHVAQTA